MAVEVVDDAVRAPPADRDRVRIDEPDPGDGGGHAEQRPSEPTEIAPAELQRPTEEVGADRNEIVPQRERDGLAPRLAVESGLRDQRVHDDERGEGDRERVDEARPKRKTPGSPRVERDPRERD